MERSESEAVFESLNLNPQLFVNETLNTVDCIFDDAFDFFHQEASSLLKTGGSNDKTRSLSEGIARIRHMIQSDLDERVGMWEKYCLCHIFTVPEGFSLPKNKEPFEGTLGWEDVNMLNDPDLDAQLESLRDRLDMIGKDSAALNRELQTLRRKSAISHHCTAHASEALQLFEQNNAHDIFQELTRTAAELHNKMEKLRTKRLQDEECMRKSRIFDPKTDLSALKQRKSLTKSNMDDLQGLLADLQNM